MSSEDKSTKSKIELSENDADLDDLINEKYAREVANFEKTSNRILEGVRQKGVSTHTIDGPRQQAPSQINDVHIYFSRQLPEYVEEGEDTSEELEKELEDANDTVDDDS